jgi:hypothetical protein
MTSRETLSHAETKTSNLHNTRRSSSQQYLAKFSKQSRIAQLTRATTSSTRWRIQVPFPITIPPRFHSLTLLTAKEIPGVIHLLTQAPPSIQRETVETYFTPSASFTHPFCRTGSWQGSRWAIWIVYRWYKIMSPRIDISVQSVGKCEICCFGGGVTLSQRQS